MSLELSQLVSQLEQVAQRLEGDRKVRRERLREALALLKSLGLGRLQERLEGAKTTWLLARPLQSLTVASHPPTHPEEFVVLASDGSHIDLDQHSPLPCCLINIGTVLLHYGSASEARLQSQAHLYTEPEELAIADPSGMREEPMEGPLLAARRTLEEIKALAELAQASPPIPTLALLDGSLILWSLSAQGQPDFVREALLRGELLPILDSLEALGQRAPLALASYISSPRSTEVVNLLRLALCPYQPPNCDRHCADKGRGQRECDHVSGLCDQDLFRELLAPGQRTPCFQSLSSIVRRYYGRHQVYFFYLRLDEEVARVEVPAWVAEREELLSLAHALVLDQARLGRCYPLALAEAHEKAVLTGRDRESFWQLVRSALEEEGLPSLSSAKSQSKRLRWL